MKNLPTEGLDHLYTVAATANWIFCEAPGIGITRGGHVGCYHLPTTTQYRHWVIGHWQFEHIEFKYARSVLHSALLADVMLRLPTQEERGQGLLVLLKVLATTEVN